MPVELEEIRGITWDLWGEELSHEQTIQRIISGGFPIKDGVALTMFAIVEGESGEYQRAWHANVKRNLDGTIQRIEVGTVTHMDITSVDLGFMQFNVAAAGRVPMNQESMTSIVENLFTVNSDLADPWLSAIKAFHLWQSRGFNPWYAYKPGTKEFRLKKHYGAKAFANWLVHSFVDPGLHMDYV